MPIENDKYVVTERAHNAACRQAELQLHLSRGIESFVSDFGDLTNMDVVCVLARMTSEHATRIALKGK